MTTRRLSAADETRALLRHVLATLAYRTQKALRGAPESFADWSAGNDARTPKQLVRHMTSVLGYARTFFVGGSYRADPLPTMKEEIARFHGVLEDLAKELGAASSFPETLSAEQLLQGPLSDAMTHAGQIALLRRLAGHPVPPENFVFAEIDARNLGPRQPQPARPDPVWREAPPGWKPPA